MYRKREREKGKKRIWFRATETERKTYARSPSVWSPLLNYVRLVKYSRVLEDERVCIVAEIELIIAIAQ